MKNIFYKYANLIFGIAEALFCYVCYLIGMYAPSPINMYLWVAVMIFTISVGVIFGTHLTKLHESVYKDHLTGLWNRRFFYNKMAIDIDKCGKKSSDVSLLIMDIDNFKFINDTYGHPCGDKVINEVADILKQSVRVTDTVARIGGEEFAMILPYTNYQGALTLAERIRSNVEKTSFYYEDTSCKVTISIGVASARDKVEMAQFMALADKALYVAKRFKNRVSSVEDVLLRAR